MSCCLFKKEQGHTDFLYGKSSGSATVESSLIFPLVVLTVVFMLSLSLKLYDKVKSASLKSRAYSLEILNPAVSAESVLRYKWIGINIIFKAED